MSSKVTPPSLSTAMRSTRFLPAGVTSTASRSRPRPSSGSRSALLIRELSGLNGLTTRPPVLLSRLTIAGGRRPIVPVRRRVVGGCEDRVAGVSGSPLTRRGVLRAAGVGGLAGALGVGALTGCDLDPHSSSKPAIVPPPDPDQDILDAARSELRG